MDLELDTETHQYLTTRMPSKLVATTEEENQSILRQDSKDIDSIFYKSAQWSADGTCIISSTSDNAFHNFIIPPDLLDETRAHPHILTPYTTTNSPSPVDAVTLYPLFDLQNPSAALVLSAINDHPIRLTSALTTSLVASYPLVSSTTELYIKPASLCFSHDGTRIIAGSQSLISTFDLSRPGEGPVNSTPTGPKTANGAWTDSSSPMRGIVSALALDPCYETLAAGTYSRQVGLYDAEGAGECFATFSLERSIADADVGGRGVTQLKWSGCGRYLYVVERGSDGILTWDIRKTGQLLGWTRGRAAKTNQRMNIDVHATGEIWAGGSDGVVRCWKNVHLYEGGQVPSFEQKAHEDAIGCVTIHHSGEVLATASGQRHFDGSTSEDCSLKIWGLATMRDDEGGQAD